jgi:ABC-type multidrug transport system ATPase subunit
MSETPCFELSGAEFRYGERLALRVPSLVLAEGEVVALVGPNGSGKTTLLKALGGLVRPSAGSLRFRGADLLTSPGLRSSCVYLHQQPYLLAGTVAYNVAFGCRARGMDRRETEGRVADSLALLGLGGFERRKHRALSGGEAQRVALARALASGADVLLLDEPTAEADTASRALIMAALKARGGATIIFSSHDAGLGAELACRTLSLEGGLVVADRRIQR